MNTRLRVAGVTAGVMSVVLIACSAGGPDTEGQVDPAVSDPVAETTAYEAPERLTPVENSLLDASEMFTPRDLEQSPLLDGARTVKLTSGEDVHIDQEGIYILSGDYRETTIVVDADESKVQLYLNGLNVINSDSPVIYVKSADKVFIASGPKESVLSVTDEIADDGETNLDALIFSRSDLVLNGQGRLTINAAVENGISSKDDLKITGGSLVIVSGKDGLEANDSIRIAGGSLSIDSGADALHSENDEEDSLGYIYIYDGELNIRADDDALRGSSFIQIDGGVINVEDSAEGLEATRIRVSGGRLAVYSSDDGINAAAKTSGEVLIEIFDGDISVEVGAGDTDAFDANGNLAIYGGSIDVVTPRSAFDVDGTLVFTGGTVRINGEPITEIPVTRGGGRRW